MIEKQIIKGWVSYEEDWEEENIFISESKSKHRYNENLRELINDAFYNLDFDEVSNDDDFSIGIDRRYIEKNVSMQLFASDKEESLESIQEKVILDSMGLLEYQVDWHGYSEYTIMGYEIQEFKLGGHNMFEIIKSYEGKYVYLVIDKVESSDYR